MAIQNKNKTLFILDNINKVLSVICATIFIINTTILLHKLYEHIRIEINYKQDI